MPDFTATFTAAPENVILVNARIDDAKAELLYSLAATASGVTNGKAYPSTDAAEYKTDRRDIVKHVQSRVNDGHSVQVQDYRLSGIDGIHFRVKVVPKSNRGRKPANTADASSK